MHSTSTKCISSLPVFTQDQLADIGHRMHMTADCRSRLAAARTELSPIACHAFMLYSLLSTLPVVNHMYHVSLQQFLRILQLSLHRLLADFVLILHTVSLGLYSLSATSV